MKNLSITLAQLNPTLGDIAGNMAKILEVIRTNAGSDIIVFPELSITGYHPMDLLFHPPFMRDVETAMQVILDATRGINASCVIGYPAINPGSGRPFFNALGVFQNGEEVHTYHKQLLPTYDVFDEGRYFEPGNTPCVMTVRGVRLGLLICEDAWNDSYKKYKLNPIAQTMECGIDGLITINASPSELGKSSTKEDQFSLLARKYNLPILYVNQVGGNDSVIFDGASFVFDRDGTLKVRLLGFQEEVYTVYATQNPEGMTLGFNHAIINPSFTSWEAVALEHIRVGLKDYLAKCGFKKVVVGSSGGIDSAITLALAVDALGAENVLAITMPSQFSSDGSVSDSQTLCDHLGIPLLTQPIAETYDLMRKQFERVNGKPPARLTLENLQARIRGTILMEYSNDSGALVLSTGNKSELAMGYSTLYGDMNGGLNLIGDLYKTEVFALSRYINTLHGREIIPVAIIEKEPSAELSDGQKDSDSLPPYDILDAILKLYLENGQLTPDEQNAAQQLIIDKRIPEDLQHLIWSKVDRSEFKRKQAPPVIRIQRRSFGIGRQIPVAQRYVHFKEKIS